MGSHPSERTSAVRLFNTVGYPGLLTGAAATVATCLATSERLLKLGNGRVGLRHKLVIDEV